MNIKHVIKRILTEEIENSEQFISEIVRTFPEAENFVQIIKDFIEKSGCKKIEVASFKHGASGLALHDGVLFNRNIFYQSLPSFLFIVFHELAHQYQYKKYGADKMYQVYLDEITVKEAAKFMKNIEIIADELATRKIRELQKLGFISEDFRAGGFYKNIPLSYFEGMISQMKTKLQNEQIKNPETIARVFYNMVKQMETTPSGNKSEQMEKLRDEDKNKINEIKEETRKDLSTVITKLLETTIVNNNDNVCKIEVTAPWNRETVSGGNYDFYKILVYFIGGYNTKNWPVTQAVRDKEEDIMNEIWDIVYGFMNIATDLYSKRVENCFEDGKKGEQNESEITERCWKGYTQKGMKTMFGKKYPNCVKKNK